MILPVLIQRRHIITSSDTVPLHPPGQTDAHSERNSAFQTRQGSDHNRNITKQIYHFGKNAIFHKRNQAAAQSGKRIAHHNRLSSALSETDAIHRDKDPAHSSRNSAHKARKLATYSGQHTFHQTKHLLLNITTSSLTTLSASFHQHPGVVVVTREPKLDYSSVNTTFSDSDNTTQVIMTRTFVSALTNDDYFSHHKTVMLLVLFSILLLISLIISISMFVFCRKKNSVFILQKCEQDSDFELDDFNTEIETSDSEYEDLDCNSEVDKQKRSETYPCLNKYDDDIMQVTNENCSLHYQRCHPRKSDDSSASPSLIPLLLNSNTAQTGVQIPQRRNSSQYNIHRPSLKKSATFSTMKKDLPKTGRRLIPRKRRKNGNVPSKLAYVPSQTDDSRKTFCVVMTEMNTAGSCSSDRCSAMLGTSSNDKCSVLGTRTGSDADLSDANLNTDDDVIKVEGTLEIL